MRARDLVLLSLVSCASAKVAPFRGQTLLQDATTTEATIRNDVSYVPAKIDTSSTEYLEESGGDKNFIVGRMRMTRHVDGRLEVSARDRLPDAVRKVTRLPEHLGGGFVFHNDQLAYFAARFAGPLVPIARASTGLKVGTGADAFFVFGPYSGFTARDPRTGAPLAKPVLPPLPDIEQIFSVSSRVVVATGPVVGPVKSVDGGQSWQRIRFDDTPLTLSENGGNVVLSVDPAASGWFASAPSKVYDFKPRILQPDGSWGESERRTESPAAVPKFNDSLREAVLRGFPLADGTVVYADHGELIRVSLDTGEVLERASHAFEDRAATCTPVGFGNTRDPKAFGFVCGSRFGKTNIYRYEKGGLALVRSFAEPRVVKSSGNGRLVVEGTCDPVAQTAHRALCVVTASGDAQAFELSGAVDDARAVAMSDGKLALITPPTPRSMPTLTLISGTSAKRLTLKLPISRRNYGEVLQKGAWLEDMQERRAGVIGGWALRSGANGDARSDQLRGFEIDIDGTVREGEAILFLGQTSINGNFGLGWPSSRLGWETTDGGMRWKQIPHLPPPLGTTRELGCSAVGCVSAGWLRIGWGEHASDHGELRQPDSIFPLGSGARTLGLECEAASKPRASVTRSSERPSFGSKATTLTKFPPFAGEPGPTVRIGERGFVIEVGAAQVYDRNIGGAGRVFAWGDPSRAPHWQATWMSLGSSKVFSTRAAPSPATTLEGLRAQLPPPYSSAWGFTPGQSPGHALFIGRRGYESVALFAVDGQPLTELRRPDGSAFNTIVASLEHAGTVSLLEQSAFNEVTLWTIDGGGARTVSRFGYRNGLQLRLARQVSDGRIGMFMTTHQRVATEEWIFPTSSSGDFEWPVSLGTRARMTTRFCGKSDTGWRSETPLDQGLFVVDARGQRPVVSTGTAFLLAADGNGCYEAIAARATSIDLGTFGKDPLPKGDPLTIPVAVLFGDSRLDLRCRAPRAPSVSF